MRSLILAGAVMAAVVGFAYAAEDEFKCGFPEAPVVPDGTKASEAEMGEAGAAVRAFVAGVQTSLECLSAAEQAMGDEATDEQKSAIVGIYNHGVDQMTAVAENYNAQVRAYTER